MTETTTTRANALIDPTLHIWHVEIPMYLFLGGLVAGLMIISGYWLLRHPEENDRSTTMSLLPWLAPVLLSIGMLFLWLDLENRWNVLRFYLAFKPSSPMSWGSWILLIIYPISILTAWVATPIGEGASARVAERGSEGARERARGRPGARGFALIARVDQWASGKLHVLSIASIIAGAALGIYTGILLGTMAARPLWNSALLGPLFLVSGISTGAAFLLLMKVNAGERTALVRIDILAIAIELVLIALWLLGLASGEQAARAAAAQLLGGPYTAAFWTMVVTLGLLTPLITESVERRHRVMPGRMAAVLVLIGGFALRWIIVYAGQATLLAAR